MRTLRRTILVGRLPLLVLLLLVVVANVAGFVLEHGGSVAARSTFQQMPRFMSFSIDGSEYSSVDSDYAEDDDMDNFKRYRGPDDEQDDTPTVELQPVPMSKNSGNRFVAIVYDRLLDTQDRDVMDLHYDRIALTEDHVMFCRKKNLYQPEFNTDSMVDIPWSRQLYVSHLFLCSLVGLGSCRTKLTTCWRDLLVVRHIFLFW